MLDVFGYLIFQFDKERFENFLEGSVFCNLTFLFAQIRFYDMFIDHQKKEKKNPNNNEIKFFLNNNPGSS